MQLLDLPPDVFIAGTVTKPSSFDPQDLSTVGFGDKDSNVIIGVWSDRERLLRCFEDGPDPPPIISCTSRDWFIVALVEGQIADLLYLDAENYFELDRLDKTTIASSRKPKLVDLRDFETVWPVIESYLFNFDRYETIRVFKNDCPVEYHKYEWVDDWQDRIRKVAREKKLISISDVLDSIERVPPPWDGEMMCNECDYDWKSRRQTPPAACPKCRSKDVFPLGVY